MTASAQVAPALVAFETYDDIVKSARKGLRMGLKQSKEGHYIWLRAGAYAFAYGDNGTNPKQRAAAWKKLSQDVQGEDADLTEEYKGQRASMMKKLVTLDVAGVYTKPWADGDFTVSLRDAYDAIRGAQVSKSKASVIKILETAGRRCEKLHNAGWTVRQDLDGRFVLTVTPLDGTDTVEE